VSEREPLPAWSGHCENDFEAAVFEAHPAIAKWREEIEKAGALLARMSGSGSTVFGLFADAASAQAAAAKLRVESGHVTVFHTIDRRRYERAWQQALAS
jgi:4-diphosphocytidyl-2-C-methyl-D-erythritol kinase